MVAHSSTSDTLQAWLVRLLLALLIGTLTGIIAYLSARAIGAAWLLLHQQSLIEATRQALQQGVMGLADTNLRALRLAAEAEQNRIAELSAWFSLGMAFLAAVVTFVRLERLQQ
jgi:Pyruvate/2-oxoacid:ferredoxin oxidoreductase gamma subunit